MNADSGPAGPLRDLNLGPSPRGFPIVDDFALTQCREAVEDFRRDRGIDDPNERIDWAGIFWRKRNDSGDTPGQ